MIIGFYVGDEKRDLGRLPFNILLAIVAVIMILSEVSMSIISPLKKIAEVFFVNMVDNNHSETKYLKPPPYLPGLGYGKILS